MSKYLFVYGSLMGSIQSQIAQLLHNNADFLGVGYVNGCLYDLGRYPGLVFNGPKNRVEGHIFELHRPGEILVVLDDYEGAAANDPDLNEYERVLIEVQLDNQPISCWAYVYQLSTENLPIIPFNNYLDYLKEQPDHQAFITSV